MASRGVLISAIRRAILLLALVVFLGYIMMWIIIPTRTYVSKWWPHIYAHTNFTFFGYQGTYMLEFTFPILFISVIGCLYLHLGKKKAAGSIMDNKMRFMRRPMIVKGLGIVNLTELSLFIMFIALCVWYFSVYLRNWDKKVPTLSKTQGEKEWQTWLDGVGLFTGLTGNLCLTFLFYPVTRGSSLLPLIGLTSEASTKYHIWIGNMAMALFTAHGLIYFLYWALTNKLSEILKWDQHSVANIPGEISLLCGLALWITTYPTIRRKMFELFFYTHYLYILFIIFFVLHTSIGLASIMLPGIYLFIIDRYLRFLQSRQRVRLLSARVLPCDTLELNFSKSRGLKYSPTSIMFINVPTISKLQWHPFTVTSSSNLEPERLSVLIKSAGSWTKNLYDAISSPSSVDHLQVSVEGPYGPASTNFLRHDVLVMISGGSGIAPFISIIRELMFINSTLKCKTPKMMLVSVFKNSCHLSMLDLILPISGAPSKLELQIEAYITREKGYPMDMGKTQTVLFKPNPSNAPISPTLGPNSWLWLAAIISSSFLIFLVLAGVYTQYVVYPIDKNTSKVYSNSKKGAMNMMIIYFSIVIAASGAFLWNKKQNAKEAKQILNMENRSSSNSLFGGEDIEMETLPVLQSTIKSMNVHYGQRPDLERILLGTKEASVGALVSGPKEMRESVAAICSSSLARNLHFEAISFTW
ncbi:ferric reduction oxidase 2-like isoform X2 [Andrographis paniculata]|uniref:ferric reduction oxidase 2-like isoform X2 n=1 Tax=Andrographis paniculata TaxID=175694 RepID=UPI0021E98010|nr:ferric reduction oxidase 2-like isoform X2 [Andrographis paniculata]